MSEVAQFIEAVGRKKIAEKVGCGMQAVTNAKRRGVLPAHWFVACRDLAATVGVECPEDMFSFSVIEGRGREPSHTKSPGNVAATRPRNAACGVSVMSKKEVSGHE